MELAPVDADHSLAEQRIVGRDRLHGVDELDAVVGALGHSHRFHEMFGSRVHARMHVVGHHFLGMNRLEALGEGARSLVRVPIEAGADRRPVDDVETERGNVGDIEDEAGKALLRAKTEFMRLLDAIVEVSARIGEADGVGAGILRLQNEGREVGGVERMAHRAQHLAARRLNRGGAIGFEVLAEGVVGGDEEPALSAGLGQRLAEACPRA